MTALRRPDRLTVTEYLIIENAATFKSEFYDGEMFAMAGTSILHNDVAVNLLDEFGSRLRGTSCRRAVRDQRVRVTPAGLYTYPDLVVTCGRRELDPLDPEQKTITNPTVLVEVLSPSTEAYDRGPKLRMYQRLDSVRAVLLVCQDRVAAEVYSRESDGRWFHTVFDDPAGELVVPGLPVPVSIPLADVYRGVDLPERPPLRADYPPDVLPGPLSDVPSPTDQAPGGLLDDHPSQPGHPAGE